MQRLYGSYRFSKCVYLYICMIVRVREKFEEYFILFSSSIEMQEKKTVLIYSHNYLEHFVFSFVRIKRNKYEMYQE